MLKKGDKCHVRLKSGEIVDAQYERDAGKKLHFVKLFRGGFALAGSELTNCNVCGILDCRFVCMTGIRGKNENQKGQ